MGVDGDKARSFVPTMYVRTGRAMPSSLHPFVHYLDSSWENEPSFGPRQHPSTPTQPLTSLDLRGSGWISLYYSGGPSFFPVIPKD